MLPPQLAAGIATEIEGVPARDLARAVQRLTTRYRGAGQPAGGVVRSDADVLAYLTYRMPATYAAVAAALAATAARRPGWRPQTLLDVGAGPGTAMWAAAETWPSLETIALVEHDPHMVAAGRRLAQASSNPAVRDARWCATDMTASSALPQSELVLAAYSLGELAPARMRDLIARLWDVCRDTLVVVEPGTPKGFDLVRMTRDVLRGADAHVLAPCPHQDACPMAGDRWCHFSERLERSRLHRTVKGASVAYEDEKYSYVAASRAPGLPLAARVIGHPRAHPGRVSLDLCTTDGLRSDTIPRRDRDRYREARRARWGSAFDASPAADQPP
jgi:ribosomal protein RSM22 (predicted rRNA methylase)